MTSMSSQWLADYNSSGRLVDLVANEDLPEEFLLCLEGLVFSEPGRIRLPCLNHLRLVATLSIKTEHSETFFSQNWVDVGDVSQRACRFLAMVLEWIEKCRDPAIRRDALAALRQAFSPTSSIAENDVDGDVMFRSCRDIWRMVEWAFYCSSIRETKYFNRWKAWSALIEFLVKLLELESQYGDNSMSASWLAHTSLATAVDSVLNVVDESGIVGKTPFMGDLDQAALNVGGPVPGPLHKSRKLESQISTEATSDGVAGHYCKEAVELRSRLLEILVKAKGTNALYNAMSYFHSEWVCEILVCGAEPHLINRIAWSTVLHEEFSHDDSIVRYLMRDPMSRKMIDRLVRAVPGRSHCLDANRAVAALESLVRDAVLQHISHVRELFDDKEPTPLLNHTPDGFHETVEDSEAETDGPALAPATPQPDPSQISKALEGSRYDELLESLEDGNRRRQGWLSGTLNYRPLSPVVNDQKIRSPSKSVKSPFKSKRRSKSLKQIEEPYHGLQLDLRQIFGFSEPT